MRTDTYPLKAVPGYRASGPGIQIGTKLAWDASDEDLRFVQQLGVEWIMTEIPHDEHGRPAVSYKAFRERIEQHDLKVYRLGNLRCHNMAEVTLNLPGRDAKIAEYIAYIRALADAGIRYSTYAHMGNGIWNGERQPIRGGAMARSFHVDRPNSGHWGKLKWEGSLSHGRPYSEDEIWDNFEYFIRKVVPVAEDAGVYIGFHPDDPPLYALGGVPRCIFGTFAGYKRAIEIAASPNVGVCLCTGCWLEGGPGMGGDVMEAVRVFGSMGRLFKVHLRNVTAPMPEGFEETYLDNGYMDMYRIVEALHQVGYDGAVMSDHLPQTIGGDRAAEALAIGTIKGYLRGVQGSR
jgi:mannonate dehydratase